VVRTTPFLLEIIQELGDMLRRLGQSFGKKKGDKAPAISLFLST